MGAEAVPAVDKAGGAASRQGEAAPASRRTCIQKAGAMLDDPDEGLDSSRPLSTRSIVIFVVSSVLATCVAACVQLMVGRVLAGAGGLAIPELAGFGSAGPAFYFCVELLRRHIR